MNEQCQSLSVGISQHQQECERPFGHEGEHVANYGRWNEYHWGPKPSEIYDQIQKERQKSILAEAQATIEERGKTHGDANEHFASVADAWNAYFLAKHDKLLTGADVCQMLVLLKIMRTAAGDERHRDHYVDQAGYTELAWRFIASEGLPL